ncbi:MAG: type II toxin-antitoxin system prevent-host-death family antitoxin [Myxococcales bacterium]|nr:type II toxin-antitoxin system prevent-host-death family antitoxin [Myxococcales bacterium]
MRTVPIHRAKTELSRLIELACAGEEVIIARGKDPVVRLVPIDRKPPRRQFGALRGKLVVDESFFEPLSARELAAWER